MFPGLFAGLFRNRPATGRPRRVQRCRLAVEQLEDRQLLSGTPAAVGTLTQTLANPTIDASGTTAQFITAGSFQTVASQTVTVTSSQNGLFQLSFQAQAFSGMTTRVGVRYLIDSQYDPNDAVIRSGTGADVVDDIDAHDYQTLYLARLLTLSPGTHTITVQVYTTSAAILPTQALAVYSPQFSIVGFSTIDGQSAADGVQNQTPARPAAGAAFQQDIIGSGWQTVSNQSVTVGPSKTGLFSLTFAAPAFAPIASRLAVRYLIDGNPDPRDQALGSHGTGADLTEDVTNGGGSGGWYTLYLTRQVVLTGGTHTITVQVMETPLTLSDGNAILYAPTLGIIGYNTVDGQHSADGLQSQTVVSPDSVNPGQQDVTAGSWQTVSTLSVPVAGIRSGLYSLNFEAQALTANASRVHVRYLIDGNIDPNDQAVATSASGADSTADFLFNNSAGVWHTLTLTGLLSLTAGTHTISVQVFGTMTSTTLQPDLTVVTPQLSVTGYNNITATGSTGGGTGGGTGGSIPPPGSTTFTYNSSTQVLVVTGTSHNDTFRYNQSSKLVTPTGGGTPTLVTTYTFSVNGVSQSYTSDQLSQVYVYGQGGTDKAYIYTNDTYTGADGSTRETQENLSLGAGGGMLQQVSSAGIATNFMQLLHVAYIYGYMGNADSAQLHDSPGNDIFVSAGLTSYLTGPGYYDYISGATSVTAYATTGHDIAYQYDGSGTSTYTVHGITSSVMTGTDHGVTFTDTAMGFHFNYGIARHSGDIANLYDAPGTDEFLGEATISWMYSYVGRVETMYMQVSHFSHVNAFATAGTIDYALNYAPTINTVTGFKHVV